MKINPINSFVVGTIATSCLISNAPLFNAANSALALEFPPTGGRGAPSRTVGGGTRGGHCMSGKIPLTALIPHDRVHTLADEKAVVFVYVPPVKTKAEWVVQDDRQVIYKTTLNLNGKAGVLPLSLPKTTSLQLNKNYYWGFSIICEPEDRTEDLVTQGMMRRVEVSLGLKSDLKKASPLQQAELYAKARIWQETLLIASQLRRTNPIAWEQLLTSIGLPAIAKEPFIAQVSDRPNPSPSQ